MRGKTLILTTGIALTGLFWSCDTSNTVIFDAQAGTWTIVRYPDENLMYWALNFVDETNGWIVGDTGTILHSSDAGSSWERQSTGIGHSLRCVCFINRQTGWAAGGGAAVLRTTDGGLTWEPQNTGIDGSRTFLSMSFTDGQTGWIASNHGEIIRTRDAGSTWSPQQSGTSWAITSIQFLDRAHGWAVATNRIVLQTSDGGLHWNSEEIRFSSPVLFNQIQFVDLQHGWIATNVLASDLRDERSPLLRSNHGGVEYSWFTEAIAPSRNITAIHFVSPGIGWSAGWLEGVYYTNTAGREWTPQYATVNNDVLVALSFPDSSHGWALGFFGTVLKYVH